MSKDYEKLSQALGHDFDDIAVLKHALTHRSVSNKNNERLEFVGDAIVNFVIAEKLFEKFPKAREGELSRLRAALVKGETLAKIARDFDLGQYLHLGVGELKSGGSKRDSILADAVEALIAAIYFDAGMDICRKCIFKWYEPYIQNLSAAKSYKDAKTKLQEYLQSRQLPLPIYEVEKIEGEAHQQTFQVKCIVDGLSEMSQGRGTSRRRAEQEAAHQFLKLLSK